MKLKMLGKEEEKTCICFEQSAFSHYMMGNTSRSGVIPEGAIGPSCLSSKTNKTKLEYNAFVF